ncbi:MAG TPA: SPOR domain-containing protein [Gemmatimonadaceae bacterium]
MTARERPTDRTGGPFHDRAAVAVVGESLGDVAREALKIARVESQSRPVLLVDLLGEGSALDEMFGDDDTHGVSDAARYGVSLNRIARSVPNADSLFVVPGGTESPLADDVLTDQLWGSWSDQCRRAGALLVVAAPADLPAVGKTIDQLDGLVMIGDAAAPPTQAPLIGRVPGSRRRATPVVAQPENAVAEAPAAAAPAESKPNVPRLALIGGIGAASAALLFAGLWWTNGYLQNPSRSNPASVIASRSIVMPGDPPPGETRAAAGTVMAAAAQWSVEIASVNSLNGAMARVRQALDSMPVPTFAATQPSGGAIWYRLLAGAYVSSREADSLLAALRARGVVAPAAGRVVQAPLAWLLEEGVLDEHVPARLFGWRQQGLPAYALIDPNGTTRIYFGAFERETDARLLAPVLDSLNLYATLVTRIGSVR